MESSESVEVADGVLPIVEVTMHRLLGLVLFSVLVAACNDSSSTRSGGPRAVTSTVAEPMVAGPVEGGLRSRPWVGALPSRAPLEDYDYVEEEYFYSGIAEARDLQGEMVGQQAPYTTRLLVARPRNPEGFNGTVLVEWFNVTAEMDLPVIWTLAHKEILRGGYAYVGVSAQTVAVGASPVALKFWDPLRYAPLTHPGDAYMHDIFSQSAKAILSRSGPEPIGGLEPKRIIAAGESQSCSLLAQYANVVDREHRVFDGYFLHSCASAISQDIDVPVLLFLNESEIDGFTAPGGSIPLPPFLADIPGLGLLRVQMLDNGAPQESDGKWYRIWEVAGGSHFDKQALAYLVPLLAYNLAAPLLPPPTLPDIPLGCGKLPNQLGMERPTRAALRQLHQWVANGKVPPSYPRVARTADGQIARDEDGLAIAGIRMPPMEAPAGTNVGDDCPFIGSYTPFSRGEMMQRYSSEAGYLVEVETAAAKAVASGSLIDEDAVDYLDEAAGSAMAYD